jgi:hypothetical protein
MGEFTTQRVGPWISVIGVPLGLALTVGAAGFAAALLPSPFELVVGGLFALLGGGMVRPEYARVVQVRYGSNGIALRRWWGEVVEIPWNSVQCVTRLVGLPHAWHFFHVWVRGDEKRFGLSTDTFGTGGLTALDDSLRNAAAFAPPQMTVRIGRGSLAMFARIAVWMAAATVGGVLLAGQYGPVQMLPPVVTGTVAFLMNSLLLVLSGRRPMTVYVGVQPTDKIPWAYRGWVAALWQRPPPGAQPLEANALG